MKIKTKELLYKYMNENKIKFNEDFSVDISLSDTEISDLLEQEYQNVVKSDFKAKLSILFSELVTDAALMIKDKK